MAICGLASASSSAAAAGVVEGAAGAGFGVVTTATGFGVVVTDALVVASASVVVHGRPVVGTGVVDVVSRIVWVGGTYTVPGSLVSGLPASRIVPADRPSATSAELRFSTVRLVDIAMAATSFGACTLVSTRMPAASKRLRTAPPSFVSRMRSMLTRSTGTPAARATDCLNLSCSSSLNSCLVSGSATAIFTTYAAGRGVVVASIGVGDVGARDGVVVVVRSTGVVVVGASDGVVVVVASTGVVVVGASTGVVVVRASDGVVVVVSTGVVVVGASDGVVVVEVSTGVVVVGAIDGVVVVVARTGVGVVATATLVVVVAAATGVGVVADNVQVIPSSLNVLVGHARHCSLPVTFL